MKSLIDRWLGRRGLSGLNDHISGPPTQLQSPHCTRSRCAGLRQSVAQPISCHQELGLPLLICSNRSAELTLPMGWGVRNGFGIGKRPSSKKSDAGLPQMRMIGRRFGAIVEYLAKPGTAGFNLNAKSDRLRDLNQLADWSRFGLAPRSFGKSRLCPLDLDQAEYPSRPEASRVGTANAKQIRVCSQDDCIVPNVAGSLRRIDIIGRELSGNPRTRRDRHRNPDRQSHALHREFGSL